MKRFQFPRLSNWTPWLRTREAKPAPRRSSRTRLSAEVLELRTLLSINPMIIQEAEPNNASSSANDLTIPADSTVQVTGALAVGDRDFYSFNAPANAKVWAYIDTGGAQNITPSTNPAASRDSILTLFTTDGASVLQMNDDGGGGTGGDDTRETTLSSFISGRTLPVAGKYFLEVSSFNDNKIISPYTVYITVSTSAAVPEMEGNDTPAVANPLSGSSFIRSGNISTTTDTDVYSIQANAGDQIYVSADGNPQRDAAVTQLQLALFAPDTTSQILLYDQPTKTYTPIQNGVAGQAFDFRVTTSGTYYLQVKGANTGAYQIMAQTGSVAHYTEESGDNNSSATATPLDLSSGAAIAVGNLPVGDRDFYSFTAPANARVWAYVDTGGARNIVGSDSSVTATRDSTLTLFTTDGATQLAFDDDGASGNGGDDVQETALSSAIVGKSLTAAGTYYLKVETFLNQKILDPYRLFVYVSTPANESSESEGNNTAAVANPIGAGSNTVVNATLSATTDKDFYSVQANPGDTLYIATNGTPINGGTTTDTSVGLFAPDGVSQLALTRVQPNAAVTQDVNNSTQFEAFNFRVISGGTYFVRVSSANASTGAYQLLTTVIPAAAPAVVTPPPPASNVLRVYNIINTDANVHFYTTNKGEHDALLALVNNSPSPHHPWQDFGTTFTSFGLYQTSPGGANVGYVERLYNSQTSEHYYTTSLAEAQALDSLTRERLPTDSPDTPAFPAGSNTVHGWIWENKDQSAPGAFQGYMYVPNNPADTSVNNPVGPAGTLPVFRLYQLEANPVNHTGDHTLTNDPALYTSLRSNPGYVEHSMVGFAPSLPSLASAGMASMSVSVAPEMSAETLAAGPQFVGLGAGDDGSDPSSSSNQSIVSSLAIAPVSSSVPGLANDVTNTNGNAPSQLANADQDGDSDVSISQLDAFWESTAAGMPDLMHV